MENNEKHYYVSSGRNPLDEINSKGKDEYLGTWQQELQNKHTEKRIQTRNKQSFNELQGNNKQPNTQVIKSTQGKEGWHSIVYKEMCLEIFQIW